MAEIKIVNLHKRFDNFVAVRDSSMTIKDGEFFVLLGPSGCGKTTTLRMIAGLEIPSAGLIHLDGEDVTYKRGRDRDIAFVFQLFALYPHMNVRQNISFPLRLAGVRRREVRERTEEVARMLRIDHILDRPVGGLSSGDRQRVSLGRAIIRRAKAFLMDEPLGALDAEFRELMCEELRLLHDRVRATTVYVTHDQVEAMSMADRIAIMNNGDVLQIGTPLEVYDRPATQFVAGFIGSPAMNFLTAEGRFAAETQTIRVNGSDVPVPPFKQDFDGPEAILGIRPEHVSIDADGPLSGSVYGVEYMGTRQLITVDTHAGRLKVRAPNTQRVSEGENVGLRFNTERIVVFDQRDGHALSRAETAETVHG